MRPSSFFLISVLVLISLPKLSQGETQQDALFQRILKGTKCEQFTNNGRYCTYQLGDTLSLSIKDVGGTDTVVGFQNSDIKKEFYAVLYFGCVVVIPGLAHARDYPKEYGVHISPKTGLVYRTSEECRSTLKT